MPNHQIARQRLYLTGDKQALVPAGHKEAATLYANEGTIIPESACEMFGLKDGKLPGGKKSAARSANKMAPPPANKLAQVPQDKTIQLGGKQSANADADKAKAPELTDIDGIGPATAKRLIEAGIAGVAGLAAVDLAKRPEIKKLPATFDWGSAIAAAKKLTGSTDDEAAATGDGSTATDEKE
ncbi:MAG: hypothetical protein CL949_12740 [Erythrobacter sp.]|nr:hypothetical protein [Erythrobacter sp.]|tara:strand:+ start:595 stop:1143 length:549 start_codon:yes stop_codon:yes gene_type:complete